MVPHKLSLYKESKRLGAVIFPGALLLLFLGNLGAGSLKMEEAIQVTGRIYVMGHEPFSQLGIELDNGEVYALVGDREKVLRGLQGKRLTVKGKFGGKTRGGAESIQVSSFKAAESK
jgi:hypothetical protein